MLLKTDWTKVWTKWFEIQARKTDGGWEVTVGLFWIILLVSWFLKHF